MPPPVMLLPRRQWEGPWTRSRGTGKCPALQLSHWSEPQCPHQRSRRVQAAPLGPGEREQWLLTIP